MKRGRAPATRKVSGTPCHLRSKRHKGRHEDEGPVPRAVSPVPRICSTFVSLLHYGALHASFYVVFDLIRLISHHLLSITSPVWVVSRYRYEGPSRPLPPPFLSLPLRRPSCANHVCRRTIVVMVKPYFSFMPWRQFIHVLSFVPIQYATQSGGCSLKCDAPFSQDMAQ